MRRLLSLLAIAIAAFGLTSCEALGFPSNPPDNNKTTDEYYVRYTISSAGAYLYFSDIYYADVYGTGSANKGYSVKSWNVTIGPVKRGFKAFVRNEKGTGNNQIEVSKNNGPFALKASGQNSASYTINF
jgi:hypothetical protein